MKGKTLLLLLLLFGILFGISQVSRNGKQRSRSQAPWVTGEHPFSEVDLNAVTILSLSKGEKSLTLEKQEGIWTVKELYDYPAAFSRLTDLLRALPDRKVGEFISNPTPFLKEYGLLDGSENPPTKLSLLSRDGSSLLNLSLGETRTSSGPYAAPGKGQFIQLEDGQVLLMDESIFDASVEPEEWIRPDLLNLTEAELQSISVNLSDQNYTLNVIAPGQYELVNLKEGETLKSYEPGRIVRSVQNLELASVADPNADSSMYALGKEGTFTAVLKDGRSYTISLGEKTPAGNRHYVGVKAAFIPPAKPDRDQIAQRLRDEKMQQTENKELDEEQLSSEINTSYDASVDAYQKKNNALQKQVDEQNAFFSAWTFEVINSTAESMIMPRENLVDIKQADTDTDKATE